MAQMQIQKLVDSFNPVAASNVMCRFTISVGWDGQLYDCDFNQMLELNMDHGAPDHIKNFNLNSNRNRRIVTGQHCYGSTAGAGSSCGVESINIDFEEGLVVLQVTDPENISEEEIRTKIEKAGFTPREIVFSRKNEKPDKDD